jgi:hypothetical protein
LTTQQTAHRAASRAHTKAEIIEHARRVDERQREEARQRTERRQACRGGTEIVLQGPEGPYVRWLARPVEDVFIELAFADRDVISMQDGLSSSATIRRDAVIRVRRLAVIRPRTGVQ